MGCLHSRQDINDVHPNIFLVARIDSHVSIFKIFHDYELGYTMYVHGVIIYRILAFLMCDSALKKLNGKRIEFDQIES